jgi:FlaG/FlaF family flagellin (archaellin)
MAHSKEHAVSPVVGVMLMLVVTIIIASVVSAFAGGLWGNTDKAPVVTIQADINSSDNYNITLTDMGGDPFQIRDVKLIVSNDSWNIVYTNTSTYPLLTKVLYNQDPSPMLIRAGDKIVGNSTGYSLGSGQYKWTLIHIPSQKTIATGNVFT